MLPEEFSSAVEFHLVNTRDRQILPCAFWWGLEQASGWSRTVWVQVECCCVWETGLLVTCKHRSLCSGSLVMAIVMTMIGTPPLVLVLAPEFHSFCQHLAALSSSQTERCASYFSFDAGNMYIAVSVERAFMVSWGKLSGFLHVDEFVTLHLPFLSAFWDMPMKSHL